MNRALARRRQSGVAVVEFALVGLLVFIVLFGALEFSRLLYTFNSLTEGTRRAARMAAVCPPGDPAVTNVALFRTRTGADQGLGFPGLTAANVQVRYLNAAGGALPASNASIPTIAFVEVSIVNYTLALNIPVLAPTVTLPPFRTVLPRESLGLDPGSPGPPVVAATRVACNV